MSFIDDMLSDKIFKDSTEIFDKEDTELTQNILREEWLSMDEEDSFYFSIKGIGGKFW